VILAARSAGEVRNRRNYPPDFGAPPGYKSGPTTFSSHLIQLAAIAVTRGRESAAKAANNPPMRRRHVVWMPRRALSIVSGISLWRLATGGQVCARQSSNLGGTTFVPWTARCRVKSPVRPCSLDSPQPPLRVAPSRSKLVVAGHVIWAPRLWRHRADCAPPQLGRGGGRRDCGRRSQDGWPGLDRHPTVGLSAVDR
jgi:hypothetical protein